MEFKNIKEWAEYVEKLPSKELTMDESENIMSIMFSRCAIDNKSIDKSEAVLNILENGSAFASVLWKRIKYCHSYEITPSVALILEDYITNFGISTMLANYMQYKAHKLGLKKIGIYELLRFIFPNGFISEENWHNAWDLQKLDDGTNMLDDGSYLEDLINI